MADDRRSDASVRAAPLPSIKATIGLRWRYRCGGRSAAGESRQLFLGATVSLVWGAVAIVRSLL
jgi:hypothetical protein